MKNPGYSAIKTEDGTYSVYSDEYQEAMHSASGAYEEAVLKHVYPSKILESRDKELLVLDIGFGIGYNILALIAEFSRIKTDKMLRVISLEKDVSQQSLMNAISFNDERDSIYKEIKSCIAKGKVNFGRCSLEIKFGDARNSIKEIDNAFFNAVFHDPYSPSKNPELWSVEFFTEVKKIMKNDAVLTTYSSAPQIRMALIEAGFCIGKGPSVGKKREGTLASAGSCIVKMGDTEIRALMSDVKSTPYRDPGLKSNREDILAFRISTMSEKKRLCEIDRNY